MTTSITLSTTVEQIALAPTPHALARDLREMLHELRKPPETSHGRRKIYVYSLAVEYPKGSKDPGWKPEGWHEHYAFRWPKVRTYLSERAAQRRADLLQEYGAVVRVLRSEPVVWSDG